MTSDVSQDRPVEVRDRAEDPRGDPVTGRELPLTQAERDAATDGDVRDGTADGGETAVATATEEAISDVLSPEEAAAVEAAAAGSTAEETPRSAVEEAALSAAAQEAVERGAVVETADALDWNGAWRSFWRGGQALLTLKQEGERVTGTYQPGEGSVEATLDGILLRGVWTQPGAEGIFEFAMAPDGESFVGRFGNGEYWNGVRLPEGGLTATLVGQETPHAAFSSLVSAVNAAQSGDALAEILVRRYVAFAESDDDSLRSQNARLAAFLELVDIATFRLLDVPETGENGRAEAKLGIAGTEFTFPVTLVETAPGTWSVLVPLMEALDAIRADVLEVTEAPTLDDLRADRRYSPRQAVRDFVMGTRSWKSGGSKLAMDTLDLSGIPESLRATDGPIAAEYLRQILIRLGNTVWQEIPNDPDRRQPLMLYENAGGQIAVDSFPQEDGSLRWLFTADALKQAPAVFEAMQNLPLAEGMTASEPLTSAFALRTRIREISPDLLKRQFLLENWQWLGIGAALLIAFVGAWLVSRLLRLIALPLLRANKAEDDTRNLVGHLLGWPVTLFLAGGALMLMLRRLGLRQDISEIANVVTSALLVIGGTYFLYYLVSVIANSLAKAARNTETKMDDIAIIVVGGVAKIGVLVGGTIALAELLSLPYEGVIAALGVGGLALGFAARDAVSNFIGAGILMADRPFKQGDFVDIDGVQGTVEQVGMRSTRIRTADDSVVTLPNAQISEGRVNNMGQRRRRQLSMTLGLTYDTPRAKLEDFTSRLEQMLEANEMVLPGARVVLDNFGASSIDVDLLAFLRTPDLRTYVEAKHGLIGDILELAEELGVEFAFPSQTVYFPPDVTNRMQSVAVSAAE